MMRTQHSKLSKPKPQPNLQRNYPPKISTSKERQLTGSPLKIEVGCNSARNSKTGSSNPIFGYEPLKSGSLVSSIVSPSSRVANRTSSSSNGQLLSSNKPKEKRNRDINTPGNQQGHKFGTFHDFTSNYNRLHGYNHTSQASKETMASSSTKATSQVGIRKMLTQENISSGSVAYPMSSGKKINSEVSPVRRSNLPHPKDFEEANLMSNGVPSDTYKTESSCKSRKNDREQQSKVSGFAPASPKKIRLEDNKVKAGGSKAKNEYLLSQFISNHLKNKNGASGDSQNDEKDQYLSTSVSQNYKRDSFAKQSTSAILNSNSILGLSYLSKRLESQNSKESSYLRDFNNNSRTEEKRIKNNSSVKKQDHSANETKNKYSRSNKHRPESSFEKHHLHSVRSAELYHPPSPPGEDQKSVNSKILASTQLDISYLDEKPKKESASMDEWKMLTHKSKKNFLNFHRMFTENNQRLSLGKEESLSQLISRPVKTEKSVEEVEPNVGSNKARKPPQLNLTEPEFNSLEALITPTMAQDKSQSQADFGKSLKSRIGVKYEPFLHEELFLRRYPKSTKNCENGKIDLLASFEEHIGDVSLAKTLSGVLKGNQNEAKTLAVSRHGKFSEFMKKNKKSKTLFNEEIEEKIENPKKRIDVYSNYVKRERNKQSNSKDLKVAEVQMETNVKTEKQEEISYKEDDSKKKESMFGAELKILYNKIKEDFDKNKAEKAAWMVEKRQMAEKIQLLEKRLAQFEEKFS